MTTFVEPVRRRQAGANHYYVDGTGLTIPGVTTVIKGFMPSEGLKFWAANVTAAYAVDHWDELNEAPISARHETLRKVMTSTRSAAAMRGTQIHSLAEKLVQGLEIEVDDEHRARVESCARFLDEWDVQPVLVERCVYHLGHGWSGTLDLLAKLGRRDDALWLLDYKTGERTYPDHALQQSAYAHAERIADFDGNDPKVMPAIDGAGVVLLGLDGYQFVPVDAGDETYRVFRHGQIVARFNKREDDHRKAVNAGKPGLGSVIYPPLYPPERASA